MLLDMPTISAVSISVTAILGFVLVFSWSREPTSPLTGWWGLAQLLMCAGIIIAVISARENSTALNAFGQAWMILSGSLMWIAARQFEGRGLSLFWLLVWPLGFLGLFYLGDIQSFDARLVVACSALAVLSFLAASELSRDGSEVLTSRWPTVAFLIVMGIGYLAWLPLTFAKPIREAGLVFSSNWLAAVILFATLGRIALAFLVLAMVKERQELKQRTDALTDPLTGLPNRRALFEAAEKLGEHSKYLKGDPISVLVFDLDRFKTINDRFGHRLGDRVLQLFASTLAQSLKTGSIAGRLGGEEFAAILPGANLENAAITAEAVRVAFATSAAVIDGVTVAGTVSVGAAAEDDIDCDLATLFHRADGALYAAKRAGRNRVELLGPNEGVLADAVPVLGAMPDKVDGREHPSASAWGSTRRYRRTRSEARVGVRPRRGEPTLS